ncbi:hypothetical protein Y032_0300g1811 [Ancylostoma ceylanicum]|uniref:Uncharacterized protein n=1 Tax=Ancylostoma ceylanicum TaxID=53326 RepID=A0A016S4C1_9BILA|nr:hypothetical protein Y032_0300g1811 [Ancylostoma ceylanicum]
MSPPINSFVEGGEGETDKCVSGCAIGQDMMDPSSQHVSVAESLEATEDCWMGTHESCRKAEGANLRDSFDGDENGEVFHRVGTSRPRLVCEVRVFFLEASDTAFDSADGSSLLSRCIFKKNWLETFLPPY